MESENRNKRINTVSQGKPKDIPPVAPSDVSREDVEDPIEENAATRLTKTVFKGTPDRFFLVLVLLLVSLGSIIVFSASYPYALAKTGDSMYYIKRQTIFLMLGLFFMVIAARFPYKLYKKFAVPAYGVAMLLLVAVLFVGISEGSAKRWIGVGSITIQPSEIMKLALVLMLAWYMDRYQKSVQERRNKREMIVRGVLFPGLILAAACGLVLLEKHLSGTIILAAIGMIVLIIGGVHIGWTALIYGSIGIAGATVFLMTNSYALARIKTFLSPVEDLLGADWQTTQGLYAIGSGGFFGVGIGNSRQKYSYVSQPQNDFVFTIWCEETGFLGALLVVALFILLLWRGYVIAMHAPDTFSSLAAFGITSQVGIQALLNMAVVTDLIPNTGISLPFFSYGGSSLVLLLTEMGVVLSISRYSNQRR
ncbi:MAG: putative lipid II flippase FtsW [Clostridia bacterium]|nr:putative lipid II flippase FtsW [Clostridia bacterium]